MKQVFNVSLRLVKSLVCIWIFYAWFVNSSMGHDVKKGLTCKDPDTGAYHAVNTTWPSTTFCGNYSCQVRYKHNSTKHEYYGTKEQMLKKNNLIFENKTDCAKTNAEIDREKLKKLLLLMADIQTNELRKFAESLESSEKVSDTHSQDENRTKDKRDGDPPKRSNEKVNCPLKNNNVEEPTNNLKEVIEKSQKNLQGTMENTKPQHFNVPTLTNRQELTKSLTENENLKKYLTTFYPNRKLPDRPVYYYIPYQDLKSQAKFINPPTPKDSSASASSIDTTTPPYIYAHEYKFIPYYFTRQNCDYNNQQIVPVVKPVDFQNKPVPTVNQLFYTGNDNNQKKNLRYFSTPKLYFDKNNKNTQNTPKLADIYNILNSYKNRSLSNRGLPLRKTLDEQNYKTELGKRLTSTFPITPIVLEKEEIDSKKTSLRSTDIANRLKALPRIKILKKNYENILGKVTKQSDSRLSIRQPEMEWKNDTSLFQEHVKTGKGFPSLKSCERCKRNAPSEGNEKNLYTDESGDLETYITSVKCKLDPEPGYFRAGNNGEIYPKCCPQKIPDR